jgi:broad specificity phosphatase PhoE
MDLVALIRHAESVLNAAGVVNGDPRRAGPLTERGERQARELGRQLSNVSFDLVMCTRFIRTRQTAEFAFDGRLLPLLVEPLLDDIDVGSLDGATMLEYRGWKRLHARGDPFPRGESLDDAARRYAQAFRGIAERPERAIAVFCHEIPIRYALDANAGAPGLDVSGTTVSNATPFLFDHAALAHAADRLDRLVDAGLRRSA